MFVYVTIATLEPMNQETRALTLYLLTKNYDNLFMLNNSMLRYIIVWGNDSVYHLYHCMKQPRSRGTSCYIIVRVIIQCIIYTIVWCNQGPGGPQVFFLWHACMDWKLSIRLNVIIVHWCEGPGLLHSVYI